MGRKANREERFAGSDEEAIEEDFNTLFSYYIYTHLGNIEINSLASRTQAFLDHLVAEESSLTRNVKNDFYVSASMLERWDTGETRRASQWQPLLLVGLVCRLTSKRMNRLLQSSGFPDLEILQKEATEEEQIFLRYWFQKELFQKFEDSLECIHKSSENPCSVIEETREDPQKKLFQLKTSNVFEKHHGEECEDQSLPLSRSQEERGTNTPCCSGKYTIKNDGLTQGQVIGEHVSVTMHFGSSQKEYERPLLSSSNQSDHSQISHYRNMDGGQKEYDGVEPNSSKSSDNADQVDHSQKSSHSAKDFFISYTHADQQWAEWIAWQLEEAGYTTVLQAWDFHAGGNFVLDMDTATKQAKRIIAVLSQDYFASRFTPPEWVMAFRRDPTGKQGILVPVRVRRCDVDGLLGPIVYIDLVGQSEQAAQARLLARVKRERHKPVKAPAFPSAAHVCSEPPTFPNALLPIRNDIEKLESSQDSSDLNQADHSQKSDYLSSFSSSTYDLSWEQHTLLFSVDGERRTRINCITWSPDGQHIAAASNSMGTNRTVYLWHFPSQDIVSSYRNGLRDALAVSWSPDGHYMASGFQLGIVKVWDIVTGEQVALFPPDYQPGLTVRNVKTSFKDVLASSNVFSVAWSPDGQHIASTAWGKIYLWEALTGKTRLTYNNYAGKYTSLKRRYLYIIVDSILHG